MPEYPSNCTKYYGPHSLACLESIWEYAHCIPEGHAHPTNISSSELIRHDSMNLRWVASLVCCIDWCKNKFTGKLLTNLTEPSPLPILRIRPTSYVVLDWVWIITSHAKVSSIGNTTFMSEYPTGCDTYYGAYPIPCLETIWDMVRCLPKGTAYPPKLASSNVSSWTGMGLRWVVFLWCHLWNKRSP